MEEIYELIMEQVLIWCPSLASIIAVIVVSLIVINKVLTALSELRGDKSLEQINKKVESMEKSNKKLEKANKMLIDKITKINGYCDTDGDM